MQQANLYTTTIPPMMKTLKNLSGILDKLSKHAKGKQLAWHPKGMQERNLLDARLISDQFHLLRQIQVACDNAKGGAARLAGKEAPAFKDDETTVAELKTRISKTLAFMKTIKEKDVAGQEARKVSLPYWKDKHMNAFGYATEYLMPNFYFHVATAYSILRANGVEIGKSDFMGAMPFIT